MAANPTYQICMFLNGSIKNDSRVKRMIQSLTKKSFVHLFYVNGDENDQKLFDAQRVRLYSYSTKNSFFTKLQNATFFYKSYEFLADKALEIGVQFDMVYANDLPCCLPAMRIQKAQKARFVYDSHEIYIETLNQSFISDSSNWKHAIFEALIKTMKWLGRRFEREVFKRLDLLITVNDSIVDYLCATYSLKKEKAVSVMNCPVLNHKIKPIAFREKFGWLESDTVVLYQGVLNEGRGLMLFVETMKKLPQQYKWLVLGDGILKRNLMEIVKNNSLESQVHFGGKVPEQELLRYTVGADIGLNLLEPFNLSKKMASPNKLFQYIHSKIPSVCSNTIENKKVIDQFNVGVLAENNAEEIAEILLNFESLFTFDNEVFLAAASQYSFDKQEFTFLEAIEKVLESK